MSSYILTIDQGTTSSRVIIFDQRGNIVSRKQKEFKQYFDFPGYVLHDATQIYEDVIELILQCLNSVNINYDEIKGVGITNQRETIVAWDKVTKKPIYKAIVWQSTQSLGICEKLKKDGYESLINEKTGLTISPYFSASKIRWILDNVDGAQELMDNDNLMVGTIDSWLIYNLTNGLHVTDYTNASRTMLFNINTLDYDDELLDIFKLKRNILPHVLSSSGYVGKITDKRISSLCDLDILAIAGDQQASLVGHNCFSYADMKITYGTGSFMLLNTSSQIFRSNNGLLTTIAYAIDGKITYALEGSVFVAGSAFTFLKDQLNIIDNYDDDNFLNKTSNGVVFVPALTGLGAPYWDSEALGSMFGMTRSTTKKDIAYATIEGVCNLNKDVIDAMLEDTSGDISFISVDGGGSKNSIMMQEQANILGKMVKKLNTTEATALGVFYLAGLACKMFDINEIKKLHKISKEYMPQYTKEEIDKKYRRWKKAIEATKIFK